MIIILCAILLPSIIPQVDAVNANLIVSAENSAFENYFAGPMIIEVIVADPAISNTNDPVPQPRVEVNGKRLQMLQAIDGNWHGYFADKDQALTADKSQQSSSPFGLQFGVGCTADTAYQLVQKAIPFSDTVGVFFPHAISGPTGYGTLGILDECSGELDPKKQIQHVIRESKKLSDSANGPGQARIPETAWPFIQLYDFKESSTVQILYSTEFEKQVANLFFDTTDELIITSLDRKTYLLNMPVFVTIQDPMLNIDPTDEDSWTFGTRPGSE